MYAKIVLLVESRYNHARDENGGKLKCEFQFEQGVQGRLEAHSPRG